MNFHFHELAEIEFEEAVTFYEEQNSSLGMEFAEEINLTIQRIIQFPLAWTKISKYCRRCITNRFPFGIIYDIEEGDIIIIAIMHLNRKPKYWLDRIHTPHK